MDNDTRKYLTNVFGNEKKIANYILDIKNDIKDIETNAKNMKIAYTLLSIVCITLAIGLLLW